jgi:Arc/MetJ-type ribon-helix-helix transcriptional regulator
VVGVHGGDQPRTTTVTRLAGSATRRKRHYKQRETVKYYPAMGERNTELTITIAPHLAAYAQRMVAAGTAPTISAVINDALEAQIRRDQRSRALWGEAAERADPEKVARMLARAEEQRSQLPPSHR